MTHVVALIVLGEASDAAVWLVNPELMAGLRVWHFEALLDSAEGHGVGSP